MKTKIHIHQTLLAPILWAVTLAVVVLVIAFRAFHLGSYDLRVPLTYHEADSIIQLMYIKGVMQDGWPNTISHLSAPFTYPGSAFPLMTSTDWLLMKAMSLFTAEPGLVMNSFWLLTLVLSAWAAAYAAWQLRVPVLLSCIGGLLYAFLPFAMIRNVHHLNLVFYLVPLLCLLAAVIASRGEAVRHPKQATWIGLLACVAQGFDYVYFSFFAVLLFGVATLIGFRRGNWRALLLPVFAAALVAVATAINLAPAFLSWDKFGKPPEMGYKSVGEAEVYGAKLRRMILPHAANPLPPLAAFVQSDADARFPNENENQTARLGLYGAAGLLIIVLWALRRSATKVEERDAAPRDAIVSLGLATVLLITVGGFGAVINVLTVADIRAYNRFSVYLAFFAVTATGLWAWTSLRGCRFVLRLAGYAGIAAFGAFSLYDQLLDARPIVAHQAANVARAMQERSAVHILEARYPEGATVLQLPLLGYPPIYTRHKMESYDHGRPFAWSRNIQWSWPSFSQRHRAWQERMTRLNGRDFIEAAILSGFNAIWIDRAAYADQGKSLLTSMVSADVEPVDLAGRFVALDLRRAALSVKTSLGEEAFRKRADELLGSEAVVDWRSGFYPEEVNQEGMRYRWAKAQATLELRNPGKEQLAGCIAFDVNVPLSGHLHVDSGVRLATSGPAVSQHVSIPLMLEPGQNKTLVLSTDAKRMPVVGDPRQLFFYVSGLDIELAKAGAGRTPCRQGKSKK